MEPHRRSTIGVYFTSLVAVTLLPLSALSAQSIDQLPNVGQAWSQCESLADVYCWEPATTINVSGVETPAASGGPYANCHRGKGPSDSGRCLSDGSYWLEIGITGSFDETDLETTYHWRLRLGSFSPDILMLGDTQKTVVGGSAETGWTLEIWAKPALKAFKDGCWGEKNPCEGEATADRVNYAISGYMRILGINRSWPSVETETVRDALRGTFITTNGMSQSWSFTSDTFMVAALGPHFMPDGNTIAPGYVKVFLPKAYVLDVRGYESLAEVSADNLEVTVSGKPVKPKILVEEGGILVDTGVEHFSAPNPTVKLVAKKSSTPASSLATSTKSATTSLKRGSTLLLSSIYRKKVGQFLQFLARGRCSVKVGRLVAAKKSGDCSVTVLAKRSGRYVVVVRKAFHIV